MGGGSLQHSFFYLRLVDGSQKRANGYGDVFGFDRDGINYVIASYGVDRLIAEIDNGHDFRGQSSNLIGSILAYVAGEGFAETFSRNNEYPDTRSFRDRYLIATLKAFGGIG